MYLQEHLGAFETSDVFERFCFGQSIVMRTATAAAPVL
jgi:hypothetical protein